MKRVAEFKEKNADILKDLMPADEEDAFLNHDVVNILKNRDHKGRRVLIVNIGGEIFKLLSNSVILKDLFLTIVLYLGTWDTKKVNSSQLFRLFYLIHELAFLEPETQVNGVVVIMNFENMSMSQVNA